jgi:hypothetical protein
VLLSVGVLLLVGCGATSSSSSTKTSASASLRFPTLGAPTLEEAIRTFRRPPPGNACQLRTEDLLRQDDYAVGAEGLASCQKRLHLMPRSVTLVSQSGDRALVELSYRLGDQVFFGLVRAGGRWYVYGYGQDPKHPKRVPRPPAPGLTHGVTAIKIESVFREIPSQLGGRIDVSCQPIPRDPFGEWICREIGGRHPGDSLLVTLGPGGALSAVGIKGGFGFTTLVERPKP